MECCEYSIGFEKMKDIYYRKYKNLLIGACAELSAPVLEEISGSTSLPSLQQQGPLSGRGYISRVNLSKIGSVIVKRYTHGGVLGIFNKCYYFHCGQYRPFLEMSLLKKIMAMGVNIPEPIAFIVKGHIFYKAWFITKEIEGKKTLAQLSLEDETRTRTVMPRIGEQIKILIKNKVCHIDLHPGNILVDPNGNVFIIDFDKAYFYKGMMNSLRDYYLCRWRRAVIKHALPEYLSEFLCVELLKNYD